VRIKEIFWTLGLKPKLRTYGTKVNSYQLRDEGDIEVAQWLHPKAGSYIPDQAEINELRKFLKPGDVCIDVGAYIGDTAIAMALALGKTGTVLALEPNQYVYKVLEENTKLNTGKTNIIPLNFAATPNDSEMEFEYSDPGFCNGGFHENISKWSHGHAFKLKVQGKNFHLFLQKNYPDLIGKIKYLKVDAEGFDLSVLESMTELIQLVKPILRVEVFKQSGIEYTQKLYLFLKNNRYKTFLFGGNAQYLGEEIGIDDMMKRKHFDIFAVPE
jgi:FkbM family methyltransferase